MAQPARLRITIEASLEVRVVVLANGNREVDVGATRNSVLVEAARKDRRLRAPVLPDQSAEVAEPVPGEEERERPLAEGQIDPLGRRAWIGERGQRLDA